MSNETYTHQFESGVPERDFIINREPFSINEQDKLLAAQLLQSPIRTIKYDFDKLYTTATVVANGINFSELKKAIKVISGNDNNNQHEVNIEIPDAVDGIFRKATIIIENEQITIDVCRNIANSYYLAESVCYSPTNNESIYTRTLLKTNFPAGQELIQLATRTIHYNCEGVNDECFKEVSSIDFTKVNSYQINNQQKKHYMRCLTNNHKIN